MNKRPLTRAGLGLVLTLGLMACGPAADAPDKGGSSGAEITAEVPADDQGGAADVGQGGSVPVAQTASPAAAEAGAAQVGTPTGSGAATEASPEAAVTEAAVTVKTGLEATDPATVQLAMGKPQLIEFFAFW